MVEKKFPNFGKWKAQETETERRWTVWHNTRNKKKLAENKCKKRFFRKKKWEFISIRYEIEKKESKSTDEESRKEDYDQKNAKGRAWESRLETKVK